MTRKIKNSRRHIHNREKIQKRWLICLPAIAVLLKLIVASNIKDVQGVTLGGWLGADGESYINGVNGLLTQGYFSDQSELTYWPAGYPIFIWLLSKISVPYIFFLISAFQTIIYGAASYYFVTQFRRTKLSSLSVLIAFILAFNPTLSLSTLVVGYESPVASCMLLIVGIILKLGKTDQDSKFYLYVIAISVLFAISTFMQPRWILTTLIIMFLLIFMQKNIKKKAAVFAIVIGFSSIAPAVLIHRNYEAVGKTVISTNLGQTMKVGVGDSTSGGYRHSGPDISCESQDSMGVPSDGELVKCVVAWYFSNPGKSLTLFAKKSLYFWSPWSGPVANGTMARNPWLKINPVVLIAESSETGNAIVYGSAGKIFSYMWVFASTALVFIGFIWLYVQNGLYRVAAFSSSLPIVVSWIVSMGTIGDHRFRIPTMGLSLFLQVVSVQALWEKKSRILKNRSKE